MNAFRECPGCGKIIALGVPKRVWLLLCPYCSAMLEVVKGDPPSVSLVYPELVNRPRGRWAGQCLTEPTPGDPAGALPDGMVIPPPGLPFYPIRRARRAF